MTFATALQLSSSAAQRSSTKQRVTPSAPETATAVALSHKRPHSAASTVRTAAAGETMHSREAAYLSFYASP